MSLIFAVMIFSCAALCIARTGLSPCPSRTICSGFPVSASTHSALAFGAFDAPNARVPDAKSAKTTVARRIMILYLRMTVSPDGGGKLNALGRTVSKR